MLEDSLLFQGQMLSEVKLGYNIDSVNESEFSVYSQWGEDGLIEYLIRNSPNIPKSFVEFGVGDRHESNTRVLLKNRNWTGLVIDDNSAFTNNIKDQEIHWRRYLTVVNNFVTRDDTNDIFKNGLSR